MGLSAEDDFLYAFEIAGVIWDGVNTASLHDGFGVQLSITDINILQSDLRTRLSGLSTTATTHIQDLIAQWKTLRLLSAAMDSGNVGKIGGLNYNPKDDRDLVKQLFAGVTGCMGMAQSMMAKKKAMQGENNQDSYISVRRG